MTRRPVVGALLTTREVAEALHLHVNTVKRIGDRGDLAFVRVSRRGDRRYHPEDVAAMLRRLSPSVDSAP